MAYNDSILDLLRRRQEGGRYGGGPGPFGAGGGGGGFDVRTLISYLTGVPGASMTGIPGGSDIAELFQSVYRAVNPSYTAPGSPSGQAVTGITPPVSVYPKTMLASTSPYIFMRAEGGLGEALGRAAGAFTKPGGGGGMPSVSPGVVRAAIGRNLGKGHGGGGIKLGKGGGKGGGKGIKLGKGGGKGGGKLGGGKLGGSKGGSGSRLRRVASAGLAVSKSGTKGAVISAKPPVKTPVSTPAVGAKKPSIGGAPIYRAPAGGAGPRI